MRYTDWSGARPEYILEIHNIRAALPDGVSLSMLLERSYVFQTSDLRDKVYALLGLGPRWAHGAITVDYTLPLSKIYKQTTRAIIEHEHTLSPLTRAGLSYQRLQDIPSWVADWSSILPQCQYSSETIGIPYRASGDSKVDVKWPFDADDNILQTLSHKVATISEVGAKVLEKRSYSTQTITSSELIIEAARLLSKRATPYPGETDSLDAFLRIWLGDSVPITGGFPAPKKVIMALNALLLNQIFSSGEDEMESAFSDNPVLQYMGQLYLEEEEIDPASSEYAEAMGYAAFMTNRRFFITLEGYFGLGPLHTKPGDEVHVIAGGKTPYVLRSWEDSERFALVGDAYVHGVMMGEVVERDGFEWEDLFLQ